MNEVMNRFSIILPVKNGGEYLKECVQSILAQTYPDFNLHILENCSNDGTAEWIQTLQDERIIIIPSETSLSIEENWARILSIQKNEFMTIIGHDDLFDKDYLQTMNELINQYPNASLYQTHFRFIDAKGNFIKHCRPMDEKQTVSEFLHSLFTDSIDTMGTGYMMRSADYNKVGGIPSFPNLLFADHSLWIQLTALIYKATSATESFSYRFHENLSKNSAATSYINAFYNYLDFLIRFKNSHLEIKPVIEEDITKYILYYCRSLSHQLLKTPVKLRKHITVSGFIDKCIQYNNQLSTNELMPLKQSNIKAAKIIDDNSMLRKLYLLFRKIYNKPIYS
jgi:glycosyltransferase involved in cell wall biosynthesis